ncbi:MAG: hypothetical protein ACE5JP_14575 [Candidatus Bipolaricaulia bacterium]
MLKIEHALISEGVAAKLQRKHNLNDIEVREALTSNVYPRVIRRFRGQSIYQVYGRAENGRYIFCLVRDLGQGWVRVITARQMDQRHRRYYLSQIDS